MNELKIFPSETYHAPVIIVGNKDALIKLREAVDQAILHGNGKTEDVFETDGEGFTVYVVDQDKLDNLPMHYVDHLDYKDTTEKWKNITKLLRENFPDEK